MALGGEESEQRRRFAASLRHAGVSIEELWLRYFTLGGQAGQFEVEAYIHGAIALPALQRDVLAHALNERLDEMYSGAARAPYSQPLDGPDEAGDKPGNGSGQESADEPGDGPEKESGAG
ncbi:hypothetical protein [Arthrobacter sp. SO3]|uniref:hypothetical protein n=1 Tax=Arthrobacter sp. SO3 TaxID=1897057 RepID=UPI001CFFBE97|nr:hypothetical protein [Arthrobacter sp. SO3]MCB5290735.1 hypothetical protein [Arthrobacter sp. SO3]